MSSIYEQLNEACKQFGKDVGEALKGANALMATNGKRERVMDRKKYVVDASDDVKKVMAMGVTHGGAIWTDTTDIENLEELNSDYINEHFGQLQDEAYKRGFEDGKWKSEDGCTGCKYEGNDERSQPCALCCNAYTNQWAAKKQDDEIKVGDEVEISQSDANGIWVVIKVEKHDGYEAYCAINKDGDIYFEEEQDRVTKTGRHFDIESILEDMRE